MQKEEIKDAKEGRKDVGEGRKNVGVGRKNATLTPLNNITHFLTPNALPRYEPWNEEDY